jgi:hypothetical protein
VTQRYFSPSFLENGEPSLCRRVLTLTVFTPSHLWTRYTYTSFFKAPEEVFPPLEVFLPFEAVFLPPEKVFVAS